MLIIRSLECNANALLNQLLFWFRERRFSSSYSTFFKEKTRPWRRPSRRRSPWCSWSSTAWTRSGGTSCPGRPRSRQTRTGPGWPRTTGSQSMPLKLRKLLRRERRNEESKRRKLSKYLFMGFEADSPKKIKFKYKNKIFLNIPYKVSIILQTEHLSRNPGKIVSSYVCKCLCIKGADLNMYTFISVLSKSFTLKLTIGIYPFTFYREERDPEKQRKMEERENRRDKKKAQPKIKQLKIKAMWTCLLMVDLGHNLKMFGVLSF